MKECQDCKMETSIWPNISVEAKPGKDGELACNSDRIGGRGVSDDFGPRLFRTGDFGRQTVISAGDLGQCAVKSDSNFGRCVVNTDAAVNSDGDFGRCVVNSDVQLSGLLYHYFGTNITNFGW